MKKLVFIILCGIAALALIPGCGGNAGQSGDGGQAPHADDAGNPIAPHGWVSDYVSDGLRVKCENNLLGYVDEEGGDAIPCAYESALPFFNGFACVSRNDISYVIDTKGSVICQAGPGINVTFYDGDHSILNMLTGDPETGYESHGCAIGDKSLNPITPFEYDWISCNIKVFATAFGAEKDGRYGYLDFSGNVITPIVYDNIITMEYEPVNVVEKDGKYGLIDSVSGRLITDCIYDELRYPADGGGIFGARKNVRWGFIDSKGEAVTDFIYDGIDTGAFSEGLAAVEISGEWGFIDKHGNEIIPLQYRFASNFLDGRASGCSTPDSGIDLDLYNPLIAERGINVYAYWPESGVCNPPRTTWIYMENPPFSIGGGTVMVPVRDIARRFGTNCVWDKGKNTMSVCNVKHIIIMTAGLSEAYENTLDDGVPGRIVPLEAPISVVNGEVFAPVSFVGEGLGLLVNWDEAAGTIILADSE